MNQLNGQLINAIRQLDLMLDDPDCEIHQAYSWDSAYGEFLLVVIDKLSEGESLFIVSAGGIEDVTDQYETPHLALKDKKAVVDA
jgi:hypothetical protein